MAAVGTAATVLFMYPYEPDQPPQADETGSTEEGIQALVDANNQFTFELYYPSATEPNDLQLF